MNIKKYGDSFNSSSFTWLVYFKLEGFVDACEALSNRQNHAESINTCVKMKALPG